MEQTGVKNVRADVAQLTQELVALRQDIHQHPEPGFEEVRTQQLVRDTLIKHGLPPSSIRDCAKTGLIVDITGSGDCNGENDNNSPVKVVAFRADLDALRMQEANHDLPYRSTNNACAHMCGHDGHTVILIGAGIVLNKYRHKLPSNKIVRLLFQPAEEGPGGAKPMVDEGCLEGVDEVYGMHNWPTRPLPWLYAQAGPVMARPTKFDVVVKGKGGHSSVPHMLADPILPAASIIMGVNTLMSRNVHCHESAVCTLTMIKSGEVYNAIPDECSMSGAMRTLSEDVCENLKKRISTICNSTAEAYSCSCSVQFETTYPAVVNSVEQTGFVNEIASAMGMTPEPEPAGSPKLLPLLASEDFSYFLQAKPGCFFFFGTQTEGHKTALPHMATYNFNDELVPHAVEFWVRLAEHRLGSVFN